MSLDLKTEPAASDSCARRGGRCRARKLLAGNDGPARSRSYLASKGQSETWSTRAARVTGATAVTACARRWISLFRRWWVSRALPDFRMRPPVKAGVAIADFMAGVHMYAGIVSALWRRETTGQGSLVEVAMFDAAFPPLLSSLAMALGTPDETPTRTGNRHGGLAEAPYNVYAARDGYVAIICVTDRQWRALAEVIGGPALADDERFTTRGLRVREPRCARRRGGPWTADAHACRGDRCAVCRSGCRELRSATCARSSRMTTSGSAQRAHGSRASRAWPGARVQLADPIRRPTSASPGPPPGIGEHTEEVMREWLATSAVLDR